MVSRTCGYRGSYFLSKDPENRSIRKTYQVRSTHTPHFSCFLFVARVLLLGFQVAWPLAPKDEGVICDDGRQSCPNDKCCRGGPCQQMAMHRRENGRNMRRGFAGSGAGGPLGVGGRSTRRTLRRCLRRLCVGPCRAHRERRARCAAAAGGAGGEARGLGGCSRGPAAADACATAPGPATAVGPRRQEKAGSQGAGASRGDLGFYYRAGWGLGLDSRLRSLPNLGAFPLPRLGVFPLLRLVAGLLVRRTLPLPRRGGRKLPHTRRPRSKSTKALCSLKKSKYVRNAHVKSRRGRSISRR